VELAFAVARPVFWVRSGKPSAAAVGEDLLQRTGRLSGRLEIVLPGEDPPTKRDLDGTGADEDRRRQTRLRFTFAASCGRRDTPIRR
jgi:hypothetical protein